MTIARILVPLALATVAACGGSYRAQHPKDPLIAKGGLDAAALPFEVLVRGGTELDRAQFWDQLAQARAVCVGEEHPNPHHHWVQLEVVRELAKRRGAGAFAVGLEMVQRPFQGPLDDYAAKRIDAAALQSRTGWAERWGYDWDFYGPTLDAAVAAGGTLVALNAPKELVKKVVRQGLESLTPDERAQVPELDLHNAEHRAWFMALMEGMGGAGAHSSNAPSEDAAPPQEGEQVENPHHGGMAAMPSAERVYTAQVLWDETMADGAARWLAAHPTGRIVILAGNGHCHDSAIVGRIKRRGITNVVSIRPVIDEDGALSDVLAKPMNDYVVVLKRPPPLPKQPAATAAR